MKTYANLILEINIFETPYTIFIIILLSWKGVWPFIYKQTSKHFSQWCFVRSVLSIEILKFNAAANNKD